MFKSIINISELKLNETSVNELIKCNEQSIYYNLKLTEQDARLLITVRDEALKGQGRIEFGGGIVKKIIEKFYDSPYIHQFNYCSVISELVEIFYYYKNETLDLIGDDELINLMKKFFDKSCFGSLELLKGRDLDKLVHNIKYNVKDYADISDRRKDIKEDNQDE